MEHPGPSMVRSSIRRNDLELNGWIYRKNDASVNLEEKTYLDVFIFWAIKKVGKLIVCLEKFKESQ